ncbi:hypothetical protein B7H26_04735 [Stenotrophomonas maltophilia]|nr:hypothetical protein B7H26_04735 [Stenotrophomonas maltophilia]MBH1451077.1 hypothetical protein [Stenotrophomonas maltophilia]
MQFKFDRLTTNVSSTSLPTDKTHVLAFAPTAVTEQPTMYASTLQLVMTADEAAPYVLGNVYELSLTPTN